MLLRITDDFDLEKITNCGQCFRAAPAKDGWFRFIHQEYVLTIRKLTPCVFEADTDENTWNTVWWRYFDLERSYYSIRQSINRADSFMLKASAEGSGIRILRQDPWEMLVSFIISQRKSIPAIRQSIELICEHWGSPIQTADDTVFSFPTAEQLSFATEEDFRTCKLGYRAPYLCHAVQTVLNRKLNLEELYTLPYQDTINALMTVKGVGIKVANCIALFAYGQTAAAPVDTWIQKIINVEYKGINPFPAYKNAAGILQQYAFYYAQNHKELYGFSFVSPTFTHF